MAAGGEESGSEGEGGGAGRGQEIPQADWSDLEPWGVERRVAPCSNCYSLSARPRAKHTVFTPACQLLLKAEKCVHSHAHGC